MGNAAMPSCDLIGRLPVISPSVHELLFGDFLARTWLRLFDVLLFPWLRVFDGIAA